MGLQFDRSRLCAFQRPLPAFVHSYSYVSIYCGQNPAHYGAYPPRHPFQPQNDSRIIMINTCIYDEDSAHNKCTLIIPVLTFLSVLKATQAYQTAFTGPLPER
jgi:hypothetical protein